MKSYEVTGFIRKTVFGFALASSVLMANTSQAAIAFQQLPATGNDAYASISAEQVADNFNVSADGWLDAITWWGSYANTPALPADQFRVSVLSDDGTGKPQITPLTTISDNISRSTTGLIDVAGSEIYRFDIALSSPIGLNSSNTYYLSVVNEFDQNDANAIWYWLLSDNVGSNYFRLSDAEAWQSDSTGNMAFSVSTVVPLPSAFGLWVVGGALIGLFGKRKV